jgi:hypothetical protein
MAGDIAIFNYSDDSKKRCDRTQNSPITATTHTPVRCTQAEKTTPTKKIDNLLKRQKREYASPQSKSVPALPITVPSLPHTCFHTRTQIKSKI